MKGRKRKVKHLEPALCSLVHWLRLYITTKKKKNKKPVIKYNILFRHAELLFIAG